MTLLVNPSMETSVICLLCFSRYTLKSEMLASADISIFGETRTVGGVYFLLHELNLN